MRVSLIAELNNESPLETAIRDLTQARDEGFTRIWMTQLPYNVDLLTVLAAALPQVPDIDVASGVLPIQNQHPMPLAQRALTLTTISGGRFTLGIGVTHRMVTEGMWGISWDRSVRRLNEYLDGLLPLPAGETVDAAGEIVTTRGALQISGAPAPEVYVAALGPQMLRVAGRRTAGTVTWMTGPKTLKKHIGTTLRAAAAEAGRPAESVRVAAALPLAVTEDLDAARSVAAQQFALASIRSLPLPGRPRIAAEGAQAADRKVGEPTFAAAVFGSKPADDSHGAGAHRKIGTLVAPIAGNLYRWPSFGDQFPVRLTRHHTGARR